jgi:hypothetical protein
MTVIATGEVPITQQRASWGMSATGGTVGGEDALLPLPRLTGVTRARCLLFGANTP